LPKQASVMNTVYLCSLWREKQASLMVAH
jgi:hypothetical protein